VLCLQQNGQDACPRSEVQGPLSCLHFREGGQKHRVHAEAEPPGGLDDPVSFDLQVVQSLALFQVNCHLISTLRSSLPGLSAVPSPPWRVSCPSSCGVA